MWSFHLAGISRLEEDKLMADVVEKVYSALNAHDAPTTLRVHLDSTTGALQFWVGVHQGRDYPRLAKITAKDASDLAAWLARTRSVKFGYI